MKCCWLLDLACDVGILLAPYDHSLVIVVSTSRRVSVSLQSSIRSFSLLWQVAIKELHELKEVDDFLKPSSDSAIKKIMSASSQEDVVRWLDERVAGDRIDESSWAEMQTWRKPPDMKLQRNIPVALDYRSASSLSAGSHGCGPLPHDPTGLQLHSRQSDTTMCDPMPAYGANHVEGDCSIGKKKYWLYSFQVAYEREQGNPTGSLQSTCAACSALKYRA